MNQDLRTCRSCGRWTVCLVEECERCGDVEVSVCETCIAETEGAVLDVQAAAHAKTCGLAMGERGHRARLSDYENRRASAAGRAVAAAIPRPTVIPRAAERCWTVDRPPPESLLQRDRYRPSGAAPD